MWLRAAVIVGAGSTSFEIIRHLVRKLPIMITPCWIYTQTQPIGVEDVLDYLTDALDLLDIGNITADIGTGPMSFRDMLTGAARIMGFKRYLLPVPFFSPRLSSYWLILMTPVDFLIAKELVQGLKSETLIQNDNAGKLFPGITPMSYEEAVARALGKGKGWSRT